MFNSIHEECGVFGIYEPNKTKIASSVYYGLYALQHRGQEACGIAICNDGVIDYIKGIGLVNEVFNKDNIKNINNGNLPERYGYKFLGYSYNIKINLNKYLVMVT